MDFWIVHDILHHRNVPASLAIDFSKLSRFCENIL
jgi:hypothetical protein